MNSFLFHSLIGFDRIEFAYEKGDSLFIKGDTPSEIFLLKTGCVECLLEKNPSEQSKMALLRQRKIWGFKEVMLQNPFQYSLIFSESSTGYHIPIEELQMNLMKDFQTRIRLLEHLALEINMLSPESE